MSLSYKRLSKHPGIFLRVCGVNIKQFEEIVSNVRDEWYDKVESKKKCHGRTSNLPTLEDKLLCLLIYYRCYISHVLLGLIFNISDSNTVRLFKKLEPIVAKNIHIKKNRSLTYENLIKLIADVTESPTERPQK